ncbi:threonine ammonia-lyase [Rhodovulum sp. DZ06]|uniref:threonine ammonia-lyase n=1 Tax=Rhodovulum sp. DZ06 TaxID=3425126 RepID=UPI003D357A96
MTDIAAIRAAAARLAPVAVRTPLLESPFLDEIAGRRVLVKAECLQRTGSFKFRGAWSALTALPDDARARGVLAYSSGNHAQGIACAAQMLGVPAVIVMPSDAPALKLANTAFYGAEVVTYDRPGGESREAIGEALCAARGLTLVRPYDEPMVIAGQGTVGLELAAQAREAGVTGADVFVCCGGGGLSAGVALALEAEAPGLRMRPVEPEGFDDMARSLDGGARVANPALSGSICDAILTPSPGEITFPILQRLAGPGVAVSDDEALRAMALAMLRLKITPEPGGAAALAAALRPGMGESPVIAVVTGGNADPAMLIRALETL